MRATIEHRSRDNFDQSSGRSIVGLGNQLIITKPDGSIQILTFVTDVDLRQEQLLDARGDFRGE